ncbi:hypothetical protein ATCC90586_000751 [Pythium insidiosum]|nr:hypothetical protein ATCC90586_000751 [Pythium insidiosum]
MMPVAKMMTLYMAAVVALSLGIATADALQVNVAAASVECFSVDAAKFQHGISLNYQIIRGVADALTAELTDGKQQVVYSNEGPSGKFISPIGEEGEHTVCFKNVVSAVGDVVVGFSLHADDPTHEVLSNADAAKIRQVQDMEDLVYELTTTLDTVKDKQAYMKAINVYHDQVITSTHNRIILWTCVEAIVLAVVSISQIAYLRRTLETTSAFRIIDLWIARCPPPRRCCLRDWSHENMSRAIDALRSRGLLAALTHQEAGSFMDKLLRSSSSTSTATPAVYCGFDPTADSLHLGNLLQGIALRHFQLAGFRPILLVGGATGRIGDPSGKSEERVLLTDDVVSHNASQLLRGLAPVVDFDCPRTGAMVLNNADWHSRMSAVDWMRDIGRHFRVNTMLTRESVKKRLDTEQGISFLEFSYQLFQAYDFLHLHRHHHCVAQLGGSDQWGNIVSGTELIRKSIGKDAFGVTLSLLTTASGEKYGKSAGNAVWLDANKTSVFDFYQYFLRADDRDVEQLLKSFTFLELDEIGEIVHEHSKAPERRLAQHLLADTITTTMHGADALKGAKDATALLFGKADDKNAVTLTAATVKTIAADAPLISLQRDQVVGQSLVDVAVRCGAAKSKG